MNRNVEYKVILMRVRVTIPAVKKTVNITYFKCVPVVLFIQHAMRMRRIMLSSVTRLVLARFSTLPHKVTVFG